MHQLRKDPLEGATVDGRYVVHSRLARGGMSTVYLATDRRLDRRVALKVLYPHLAEEPGFTERFEQEAKSAARLSHPHVVGVLDQGVDEIGGQPVAYLVMEFVSGRTLRDVLRDHGRLTPRHALTLLDAVVEGLAAAHEAGLIHRDVKPENVLLSDAGAVKIADFGLARAVSASTGTATLVGTVAYLSPELVLGRPAEAQSDIYSTGVMLFELLTGRQPFTGETPIQVALQHAQSDVPAPSSLLPGLAPDIDELVQWCTSRDPEDRPVDGAALLGELRHIRATLSEEDLDFDPSDVPGPGPEQDQLTAAVVPRLPAGDERTEALPRDAFLPRAAGAHTAQQRSGRTEVLPAAGRRDDRTGVIDRSHHATRVIGAMPATPPSGAPSSIGTAPSGQAGGPGTGEAWAPDTHDGPSRTLHKAEPDDGARPAARRPAGSSVRPPSRRQQAREAQRPQKTLQGRAARRSVRILAVLLVLLAGLVAGASWLFGAGPAGTVSLPDVADTPLAEARTVLEGQGLASLSTEEVFDEQVTAGLVVGTDPAAASLVRRFEPVELLVSKGPELSTVPDVTGLPAEEAVAALERAGLGVTVTDAREYSQTVPEGAVARQDPSGTEVRRGTRVTLTLSQGPRMVRVPTVFSLPEERAIATLEAAGFAVQVDYTFGSAVLGLVVGQSPAGEQPEGTTIRITVA